MQRCEIEAALSLAAARAALASEAEAWDAEWRPGIDGGLLALPVVFGLRRGVAVGRIAIERLDDERVRIVWTLEESRLVLQRSAVMVLSVAAVPLVGTLAWPFYPPLLAFAPFAAISGFAAWWLVVSRLRTSGPEDFLGELARAAAAERESSAPVVG
jgi:hypothetical protein